MSDRVTWIDVARGISIVLVVFSHSITATDPIAEPHSIWGAMNYWLRDIRMPLFMFVSGMLASRVILLDWRSLWRRRLSNFAWIYVVWTLLVAASYLAIGTSNDVVRQFYAPDTQMWFIAALAIYLVATKAIMPLGPFALLCAAASVWVASDTFVPHEPFAYGLTARLFLAFALGVVFCSQTLTVVSRWPTVIFLVCAAGTAASLAFRSNTGVAFFGVGSFLALAALISHLSLISAVASYIGKRTLAIFCIHPIVLLFLSQIGPIDSPNARILAVPLFTVFATAASLAVFIPAKHLQFLWTAPVLPAYRLRAR